MIVTKIKPRPIVKKIELSTYSSADSPEYINDKFLSAKNQYGKHPLLWYNGILIPPQNIIEMYLESDGFLPVLQAHISDMTGVMRNTAFAGDNTIISLYIDSRTKDSGGAASLWPIRMDFKLIDYMYSEEDDIFYIQGIPDADSLYLNSIKSYPNMSSYKVMEKICNENGLGLRSNISSTADQMNWMNANNTRYEFIQDMIMHSYISDKSFIKGFFDYQYCMNFIDVEKSLSESMDIQGILTFGNDGLSEEDTQKSDLLYITSDKLLSDRYNNRYEYFEVLNQSTKISVKNGYRTNIYYYDKTANWKNKAGGFMRFGVESNTDNRGIVLKSTPNDIKENGFYRQNTKSVYMNAIDVDNMHTNYNYAYMLNKYNNLELDKLMIKVYMNVPNFNFTKYQKIKTIVMDVDPGKGNVINERLSGGWIIKSINYYFTPEDGLKQEILMSKRELTVDDFDF